MELAVGFVLGAFVVTLLFFMKAITGFNRFRREIENQESEIKDDLRRARYQIEQFRNLRHELLTPLHLLIGAADRWAEESDDQNERESWVLVQRSGERIYAVLRGVCHFLQNAPQEEEPQTLSLPKHRMLVVDDDQACRIVVSHVLRSTGADVDEAKSAKEAISMAAEEEYDVIFMDINMPEMDGMQAAQEIRRSMGPSTTSTIVALTANSSESSRQECLVVGMNDYISKPASKAEVFSALRRWLIPKERQSGVDIANGLKDLLEAAAKKDKDSSFSAIKSLREKLEVFEGDGVYDMLKGMEWLLEQDEWESFSIAADDFRSNLAFLLRLAKDQPKESLQAA